MITTSYQVNTSRQVLFSSWTGRKTGRGYVRMLARKERLVTKKMERYLEVASNTVTDVDKVKLACIKLVAVLIRELDRPFSQLVVELLLCQSVVHGTVSKVFGSIGNEKMLQDWVVAPAERPMSERQHHQVRKKERIPHLNFFLKMISFPLPRPG